MNCTRENRRPKDAGQGLRQRGLAHAGNVFDQQVTTGQKTGHTVGYLGLFAHDHRVKLIEQLLKFWIGNHAANDTVIQR